MTRRIQIAYEIVTPESAGMGEADDRGWEDEEGIPIPFPSEEDLEEYGSLVETIVAKAVEIITKEGLVVPSSTVFHDSVWYSTIDPDRNYGTGSETYYSFHLKGFCSHERRYIFERIISNA